MRTLSYLAEKTMDAYYGDYKHEDDFFGAEDFKYYCAIAYAALLQEEYEKSYRLSASEFGVMEATINPDWFQPETVEVKRNEISGDWEAVLQRKPFSFKFDQSFSSIEGIYPVQANECRDFIRTSPKKQWLHRPGALPVTKKVYWYPSGTKIIFKNVHCGLRQVRISYIPSLADLCDEAPIAETMEEAVLRRSVSLLLEIRKGNTVDKTQDGNPNKVDASEINPNFKPKTKE